MKKNNFFVNRLSIQQRLGSLIFILLLFAIIIYGFANYYSLKKVTLLMGREHLAALTKRMSESLGQSALFVKDQSRMAVSQNAITQSLKTNGKASRKEATEILDKLQRDSSWMSTELLNADLSLVIRSSKSTAHVPVNLKDLISQIKIGTGETKLGKLYKIGKAVYFPIISTVSEKTHIIGYIVSWKSLLVAQKAVDQFSQVVGIGSTFYVGNADGSLWTDLTKVVPNVPFKISSIGLPIEYTNLDGEKMMANSYTLANTPWIIVIEFSEKNVLKGMHSFVNWIVIIGIILIIIGVYAAWVMGGNITKQLNEFINIATTISSGNYTRSDFIEVNQNNELAKLATAFNKMTAKVNEMNHELEDKVQQRTLQLENANSELEAFSYSVSHDLRTPLRAVNGYAVMLKEDFENVLGEEGNRLLENISTNGKMMSDLIDALLNFSKLGKKELSRNTVDMQLLVKNVIDELLQHQPANKYKIITAALPPVYADSTMIKQVFLNLIGNAIKYSSKKDKPTIEIGFKDKPNEIVYYVKDNGVGFDMAYSNKLFGVFQRLHSQNDFEGTGVGLALVKRIIDKHNGTIWAEGIEDEGSVFYFSLPKA
jgi:signal transduction histidine kinase